MKLLPSAAFLSAFTLAAGLAQADTVLSVTLDGNAETIAAMEALTAAYTAAHPDVTFELENRPGGADGDNFVKTRLSDNIGIDVETEIVPALDGRITATRKIQGIPSAVVAGEHESVFVTAALPKVSKAPAAITSLTWDRNYALAAAEWCLRATTHFC